MATDERVKILVVDDLPEKLLVYEAILRDLGQELVLANSGESALREVLRHEFAVILLDVNMPGIDGFETAHLIRRRRKSAHTPIIFVTAFNDEVRMAEGYSHGAVDFISAPVMPTILRAKVNVFVDLFRMTQQVRQHARQQILLAAERSQRAAAEEANRRLSYLVRASALISRSLHRRVIIENTLRLLVPEQADSAAIAYLEHDTWKAATARRQSQEIEFNDDLPLDRLPHDWRTAIEHVAAGKSSSMLHCQAGISSTPGIAAFPLRDPDRTFGVLLAANGNDAMPFSPADLQVLDSVSSRSAAALIKARLYEEIEFANQQKNRFLSMLAHELRNPLAPIQSAVDVMRLSKIDDRNLVTSRNVIARQVTHLVRLVDDLLDVSRITLGKIRLAIERFDASQVVPLALEISQPLINEGGHQLSLSVSDESLEIDGDRARLAQVLSNLLNNAAKYTPRGGTIALCVRVEEGDVVFRVRDSGVGIPAPMLAKVFDLFTQLDNSVDRSRGGLGIGLTLVREIVELHGGRVEVTSGGAGHGCEFSVRIPRANYIPAESSEAAAREMVDA